jgi:hypothetical protein
MERGVRKERPGKEDAQAAVVMPTIALADIGAEAARVFLAMHGNGSGPIDRSIAKAAYVPTGMRLLHSAIETELTEAVAEMDLGMLSKGVIEPAIYNLAQAFPLGVVFVELPAPIDDAEGAIFETAEVSLRIVRGNRPEWERGEDGRPIVSGYTPVIRFEAAAMEAEEI